MSVLTPRRRWKGSSKPQRTELYLRWSLYFIPLILLPMIVLAIAAPTGREDTRGSAQVCVVVGLATTLLTLRALRTSLDHYLNRPTDHLRRPPHPRRRDDRRLPGRSCCSARPTADRTARARRRSPSWSSPSCWPPPSAR